MKPIIEAKINEGEYRVRIVSVGVKRLKYIVLDGLPFRNCLVCLKPKRTTAHHIVPKRAHAADCQIEELRMRVCSSCNKLIHPENGALDGLAIIEKQGRRINKLKEHLKQAKVQNHDWLLDKINHRIAHLEEQIKKLPYELRENPRSIHPAMKSAEGRITALKEIRAEIQVYIHRLRI